jgi:hypothetical protein
MKTGLLRIDWLTYIWNFEMTNLYAHSLHFLESISSFLCTHFDLILYLGLKCATNFWWHCTLNGGCVSVFYGGPLIDMRTTIKIAQPFYTVVPVLRIKEWAYHIITFNCDSPLGLLWRSKWAACSISNSPRCNLSFLSILWYCKNHNILM